MRINNIWPFVTGIGCKDMFKYKKKRLVDSKLINNDFESSDGLNMSHLKILEIILHVRNVHE